MNELWRLHAIAHSEALQVTGKPGIDSTATLARELLAIALTHGRINPERLEQLKQALDLETFTSNRGDIPQGQKRASWHKQKGPQL
jgi:hypothetical protein